MLSHHLSHQLVRRRSQGIFPVADSEGGGVPQARLVQSTLGPEGSQQQQQPSPQGQRQRIPRLPGAGPPTPKAATERNGRIMRKRTVHSRVDFSRLSIPMGGQNGARPLRMAAVPSRPLASMSRSSSRDERAYVDAIVQQHQLHYSLVQLRLVGILLLLLLASRCLEAVITLQAPPIQKLSALTSLSNWLPLLPLGISLYLLGGGRQRRRQEFIPAEALHRGLLPMALICLLLLPWLTLQDSLALNRERKEAVEQEQNRLIAASEVALLAERAQSTEQIRALARRADVSVPIPAGEPLELSRWRLDRALDIAEQAARKAAPILNLSPWELQVFSLPRVMATVMLQLITGFGLWLLHRQGSREMQRHGLSIRLFFRSDPMPERQFV